MKMRFNNKNIKRITEIFTEILHILNEFKENEIYKAICPSEYKSIEIKLHNPFLKKRFEHRIQELNLANFERLKKEKKNIINNRIKNIYLDLYTNSMINSQELKKERKEITNQLIQISKKYNSNIKKRYNIIIKNIEEKTSWEKIQVELNTYFQILNKKELKLKVLIKYVNILKNILVKYINNYKKVKKIFQILEKKLFPYEHKVTKLNKEIKKEAEKAKTLIESKKYKDFFNGIYVKGIFMQTVSLNDYIIKCKRRLNLHKIIKNKIIKLQNKLYSYLDENYKNEGMDNYIKVLDEKILKYEKELNFYKKFKTAYDKNDQKEIYTLLKDSNQDRDIHIYPPSIHIEGYHGVHKHNIGISNKLKKNAWKEHRGTYYSKSWKESTYFSSESEIKTKYYAKRLKKIIKIGLHPSFCPERETASIKMGIGRIYFYSERDKEKCYGDLYFKCNLNEYCVINQVNELFVITKKNISPKNLTLCVPLELNKKISTLVQELKKLNIKFEVSRKYDRAA